MQLVHQYKEEIKLHHNSFIRTYMNFSIATFGKEKRVMGKEINTFQF